MQISHQLLDRAHLPVIFANEDQIELGNAGLLTSEEVNALVFLETANVQQVVSADVVRPAEIASIGFLQLLHRNGIRDDG